MHVTTTTRSTTSPSASHNKMTSARAIRDMDKATEAAALADIQDDEELEQKLKAMQVKAEVRRHRDQAGDGEEEEVKEPGGRAGDDELALPEERWNPHWQSNLKLLQVTQFYLRSILIPDRDRPAHQLTNNQPTYNRKCTPTSPSTSCATS